MKDKYKKLMTLVVVLLAGLATGVTNAKLVAHWGLDGNANDSVGSNHGTLVGNPIWEIGRFGGALLFNGDDCVKLPNESYFDITDAITIAAWIKVKVFNKQWQAIITKGDSAWRLHRHETTDYINFACTGLSGGNKPSGSTVWGSTPVNDGQWHHVAGIYNGSKVCLYVDGNLDGPEALRSSSGKISTRNHDVYIGKNSQRTGREFNGLIDDVVVFDHALKKEEIIQLHRLGAVSFTSEPTFLMLFNAVLKAETMVKEQRAQEAMTFLKKTIAEYEQWKQKDPNAIRLTHKALSCDLYSVLAEAKEATGAPKADVADTYRRATESGVLSAPRQGLTLLWLYENTNADEYSAVVEPFIQKGSNYLKQVAAQAEMMVREQKSKAAIRFLEGNLAAHARWQEKHRFDEVDAEDTYPGIYFQLAKAKEAVGASKKDIANAYSKTFNPSLFDYVAERVAALTWLVENERTEECAKAIESFAQERDTRACFTNAVAQVCEHFESEKDWPKFQRFLDTLFNKSGYPYNWAIFVESRLADKTDRWAKAYYTYLDSKPRLVFGRDCIIAEKYAAGEKFNEAAELYQDIVNRCGPGDDKGAFEYQLCRCLFQGGKFREALAKLESFIPNNKARNRSLVKEAMIMKGRAHVQLGEIDKAVDAFFTVMIEYPEIKEAPEMNFFVGYCYMLQDKFGQATDAFNLVVQDYPQSSYAGKARMCLIRIKQMIE